MDFVLLVAWSDGFGLVEPKPGMFLLESEVLRNTSALLYNCSLKVQQEACMP
jgi:hypothetical protein